NPLKPTHSQRLQSFSRATTYAAVAGADAVALVTEWDAFRALDFARVKSLMNAPVLVDLRNVYDPTEARAAGFAYSSIGRV
ncbi:UDP-glucose/GDP-mannose dehydrogenase family protein, partial [Novosphingobium sp. CCH12-A3]|uniref:UDP-glucose/GDP-mannose dehydrogenase family protein n=1 Tax=Novosphingobium sp. CCH12-A3 TaxID=1768752 RepID=UPI000ACC9B7E